MNSVQFSGSVTGVTYTGGIVGNLDSISSTDANQLQYVSVIDQVDTGTPTLVKGSGSVGGIYGGGYNILVLDSISQASVSASGANAGGIAGAGCGNTIQRTAMFGTVTAKSFAAGVDGLSCVLTLKDVLAVGSVKADSQAEAGMVAGGYLNSNLSNIVSMVKITDKTPARASIAGAIGNYDSKGFYGDATLKNKFSLANAYYQKSANPDLTDPLQIWLTTGGLKPVQQSQGYVATALSDTDVSNAAKFPGLSFKGIWVLPKSVPASLNGGKVFPVLKSTCGKAGVVCP